MIPENVGLVESRNAKGFKGGQKLCSAVYKEILFTFPLRKDDQGNSIEVEMPVGLLLS